MKNPSNTFIKVVLVAIGSLASLTWTSHASVTINYEVAEIKSGGVNIAAGTVFFISHGSDNVLNSNSWISGSNFILGDDKIFAAVGIVDGVAAGALASYDLPSGTVANTTKFSSVFIKDINSSIVDLATGVLKNGATFGTSGGTTYSFGTYRTDAIEAFGNDPTGNMAWIFPADGATLQLSAYSGTGDYTGQDITASLITTSSFVVIPEPSTATLACLDLLLLRRPGKNRKG